MRVWLILAVSILLPALTRAADIEDGWRNLKRVTRDRLYAVVLHDGHCAKGFLVSANDQVIVVRDSAKDVVIKRADALRVSDDNLHAGAHDTVFSGRSSWSDVMAADPKGPGYLHISMKGGEELKWSKPTVSDGSLSFEGRKVAKTEVRYVSYVRLKPLTRSEQYVSHENVDWLAPRLWFNYLMLGKISVLLYNAELVEDNSPAGCR